MTTIGKCPVCDGKGKLNRPYEELTPRQREVLQVYLEEKTLGHACPKLGVVSGRLGVSKETVHQHLQILERKGYVNRVPNASAGVHVLFDLNGEAQ